MKSLRLMLLMPIFAFAQELEKMPTSSEGIFVIPSTKMAKPAPLFFSADVDSTAKIFSDRVEITSVLQVKLHQGQDAAMSLEIVGSGDITELTGDGLKDWAVRRDQEGKRFLDLRVTPSAAEKNQWSLNMRSVQKKVTTEDEVRLLLPSQGAAVGFSMRLRVDDQADTGARIVKAEGFSPIQKNGQIEYVAQGNGSLTLAWGNGNPDVILTESSLIGMLADDGKSIHFTLEGNLRAKIAGATMPLFIGKMALADLPDDPAWSIHFSEKNGYAVYQLHANQAGDVPIKVQFDVPVSKNGSTQFVDFSLPAGVVTPVWLRGWKETFSFIGTNSVVPKRADGILRGFIPADGSVKFSWQEQLAATTGALFFSSNETVDIRVGSGLMRTNRTIEYRVLQGELDELVIDIDGPGEILSVQGTYLTSWKILQKEGKRQLQLRTDRPIHGSAKYAIESQLALSPFPHRGGIMKLTPVGTLRHSGLLRIANEGSVKIQVVGESGLIQLAPEQFPIAADGLRLAFVYRFPSAAYDCQVLATHILPEYSINEVTLYQINETEREILADVEIDIREAPLRDWEFSIPADYSLVMLQGSAVADFTVGSTIEEGKKRVKVLFVGAVQDRQLLSLKLEKNEAVQAGDWTLPQLDYPGAKSRRGFIGIGASPGFRTSPGKLNGLVDTPIVYFPKPQKGLQHSWRIREGNWSAQMNIVELGQSVQADVFHLYTIKEGAIYGSVVINYFTIGSPATEWRVYLPEKYGNVDLSGQGVGHEWRREGDTLIVPLNQPLLGLAQMLIRFEQPVAAAGTTLLPGEIYPMDVQMERGYIHVVSPLQVKHETTVETGSLLPLQAEELPNDFRLLSSTPTLRAWQYTMRDFKAEMKFSWFPSGEMVEQVVDFVKLSTQLSRNGQSVTEAKYIVKSERRDALRVTMPQGTKLLDALVSGESVSPRVDGGELLIPLPQVSDRKEPVAVTLRYGSGSHEGTRIRLSAPLLKAPLVMGEWQVRGDEQRVLQPISGTADVVDWKPVPTGLDWFYKNSTIAWMTLLLLVAGLLWMRFAKYSWIGLLILVGLYVSQAVINQGEMVSPARMLQYVAPVTQSGSELFVEIDHVSDLRSSLHGVTWISIFVALLAAILAWKMKIRLLYGIAVAACCYAILSIRGGISLCFFMLAGFSFVALLFSLKNVRRKVKSVTVTAASCLLFFISPESKAEELHAPMVNSMSVKAEIVESRLQGSIRLTVQAKQGQRYDLAYAPVLVTSLKGDGLRITRETREKSICYQLLAEQDGTLTADLAFEMPITDPRQTWILPLGDALVRKLEMRWNQSGWQWTSPQAVWVRSIAAEEKQIAASFLLHPKGKILLQPFVKRDDNTAMPAVFYVESSQFYFPAPGVINGRHRFEIRPSQGRVSQLSLRVPQGLIVSNVLGSTINLWRFDPKSAALSINIEPAQDAAFSFLVETQRGSASLPLDWTAEPIRVTGPASEVGLLALAIGDEAKVEVVSAVGMSQVNADDFPRQDLPKNREGNGYIAPVAVYRYGTGEASLKIRVTEVEAELRVETHQVLSLATERVLLAIDLEVNITRAGVFRLVAELPAGMEVETVSGSALSDWTESMNGAQRLLTLQLLGRTMGQQSFNITLTGAATGAKEKWSVPRFSLVDATKETGTFIIVPERGLRIGVMEKGNVSATDIRELEQRQQKSRIIIKPGALAFQMLQKDWKIALSILELQPWITAQVYHESIIREGQVMSKISLAYQIENAAVKSSRVRIPGLAENAINSVRAEGTDVADFIKVKEETDLWEIRFKTGIIGRTQLTIEFLQQLREEDHSFITPLRIEDARQTSYQVGIRPGGRLELSLPNPLPEDWSKSDAAVVASLFSGKSVKLDAVHYLKANDKSAPLKIGFQRLDLAQLNNMRVIGGELTTLLSTRRETMTAVNLQVKVKEKDTMHLTLPTGASLYNVTVNDEAVALVRNGAEWRFYVFPSPQKNQPAIVRFVYATAATDSLRMESPRLNVAMENLHWRVIAPAGISLKHEGGDFDWVNSRSLGNYTMEDYTKDQQQRSSIQAKNALAMLSQAQVSLNQGDQEQAAASLGNAARNGTLDVASNEDARVQYSALKVQQAVLGLNSRRQRIFLDNQSNSDSQNKQLEQAALINPVLQGRYNYDPKQFERFTDGNTEEENAAVKDMARRIVTQQLAAEPAPSSLDLALPEFGTIYEFRRNIQVDGEKAASLDLSFDKECASHSSLGLLLCLVVGFASLLFLPKKKKA